MLTAAAVTGILSVPGAFAFADADADAVVSDSPGVASGNSVSVPVNVPVNICGNSLDIIAALNPAFGTHCANVDDDHNKEKPKEESQPETEPAKPDTPAPVHQAPEPVQARTLPAQPQLAETGGNPTTIAAAGLGAVLLTGGVVLYRRGRAVAARA
ncbi:chaplin [Streptomyces odontomachi]|uniref:chaplin n=1 Tax=Streptomyces odontomachi TaxID=2944940 RepID=UPI00272EB62B|nr:chaplin [Streptomyces sp. ODS25]